MQYELTVTLRPAMYKYSAEEQFEKSKPWMVTILLNYQVSCVAELTQSNNVHYHAIIELKDHIERDKLINKIRQYKMLGKISCSQLINNTKWIAYLQKDYSQTMKIIKTHPDVRDYYGIFGHKEFNKFEDQ